MKVVKDNNGVNIELNGFRENYLYKKLVDGYGFHPENIFQNKLTLTYFFDVAINRLWANASKFYNVGNLGITDGYWLVLLSPLILVYWIILSVLSVIATIPLFTLYIFSGTIWLGLFEAPSDVLNQKKIDRLVEAYKNSPVKHPIDLLLRDYRRENRNVSSK